MADQADLIIELIDRVTRTAKRIEDSLAGIQKSIGGVDRAAGSGSFLGTFFGTIAAKALEAGAAFLRFGVNAATGFLQAVAGAASLRETSIKAFEALRHGESGLVQFEKVKQVAIEMGTSLPETVKQFQKLAAAQFSMDESVVIFKRMQDLLRATGASAEVAERAILSITQIKAKGRLQMEELMQLNEAGLSMELVFKALSKNTGKSIAEIQKAMLNGQITAAEGIKAIQDAIGLKTGGKPPGAAALEIMNSTLTGLIDRVKNFGGILLDDIAKQLGPAMEALKPIIEDVFAAMQGPEAKGVVDGIAQGFISLVDAVRIAWPLVKAFAGGFAEGFKEAFGAFKEVGASFLKVFGGEGATTMQKLAPLFRFIGQTAGMAAVGIGAVVTVLTILAGVATAMVGGIVAAFGAIFVLGVRLHQWFQGLIDRAGAFAGEMLSAGMNAANNLINGLVNGIFGGIPRVVAAITSLGTAGTNALSTVWKEGSPSKVFTDMGLNAGTSVGGGLTKSETAVRSASSSMGDSAVQGAAEPMGSGAQSGAGFGGAAPSITYAPHIEVHAGPGANPQQIADLVDERLRPSFSRLIESLAPAGA